MTKHFQTPAASLVGLTESESSEFKRLSESVPNANQVEATLRDARWIELYLKQETAKILAAHFTVQKMG